MRTIVSLATVTRRHVTPRELAAYWGIDRRVIYKWIDAGLLPAVRFPGRIVRVRTAEAIAFEQRHDLAREVVS